MAALPYMQFYVADYLADTAHLTTIQHGAYMLLLMNYWQRGKPLSALNERLASVARMSNDQWNENVDVLKEFFQEVGGEWVHARIERDLATVKAKSDKASAAGRASGSVRSNARSTDVHQTLNHTDTDKIKNRSIKPPISPIHPFKHPATATAFAEFWSVYPKRVNEKGAKMQFIKTFSGKKPLFDEAMKGLREGRGVYPEKQFNMPPTKWMKEERWRDEIIPSANRNGKLTDTWASEPYRELA